LNAVIDIDPPTVEARRLWASALKLARDFGADDRWVLVGGLMVQLHAFERSRSSRLTADVDGSIIEILGSEGVREDPKTLGKHTTFQVPGGTQALARAEVVRVSLHGGEAVEIRRPSLLGAILIKARVVKTQRDKFGSDRQDLIRLLSFVDDPRALAAELKGNERKWLREIGALLAFDDGGLADLFSAGELLAAEQAYRLLVA
jgi:hypothetical protein